MSETTPSASIVDKGVAAQLRLPAEEAEIEALRRTIIAKLSYTVGKDPVAASARDWFIATALAVRDRVIDRWMTTTRATKAGKKKRVYYLSLEFLIGRLLMDSLNNLGITETMRAALADLGVELDELRKLEPDPALGNGGLGRLAACYMESMASLGIPAHGYGIRYDHGLFRQVIKDGRQQEFPDNWLSFGNPWEFERPEVVYPVGFGGVVEALDSESPTGRGKWSPAETVDAVAYDTPIVGWRGRHVNTLRLWSARAPDPLRLDAFNRGDHVGALAARARAEAITQVLYPSDESEAGEELRLRQEYFFASASLQDLLRRHRQNGGTLEALPDSVAIQLNDTHPAIGIAEMMRLLLDEHGVAWEEAWRIAQGVFSYTNHTLLPEALESWPVPLLERLLPRHMQIVYLINALHLDALSQRGEHDEGLLSSVSLIEEHGPRRVRMGALSFLGSHKVNGVSALHTELMRETVFRDFHRLYPDRIVNKTNGITFRRWLHEANPGLTKLLVDVAGERVLDDPAAMAALANHADDTGLHERLAAVRHKNKATLAALIQQRVGVKVDPAAMFDVQIKRIHEYKRQLLNILETVALYDAMRAHPTSDWTPRVKIFAGKAAASYHRAKLIIKLINDVARVVNGDASLRGRLKVVFLPNYNVSLAEAIIPASDLSEQISTAGMEASGTGNMKLALNGALTIGTLDGANIEMLEHVGADNMFIFGMTAEEVEASRRKGIDREAEIAASPALRQALDEIRSGRFSPDEPGRYAELVDAVTHHDYFLVGADFDAYAAKQAEVAASWGDQSGWWRSAMLNIAHMGWFSSDRAVREYADDIWKVPLGA
ncbi:MAG: glycogen/starch/alpha-glucan phosphorylase [Novosphingobium sp.]|nr:glycogen/starch/alpha-glucan phosphorylase [Novosphingobium sp.]